MRHGGGRLQWRPMSRKAWIQVGKVGVSIAFFALVFRSIGLEKLRAQASSVNPVFVALSVLISFAMVMVSCLKWRVLLGKEAPVLPFRRMFRYYLIGYYFTCLLPSNIGGDIVRSYYAGRDLNDQGRAGVSVFLERFTGLILLLILVVFAPAMGSGLYRVPAIFIPAAGAIALLFILILLSRISQPWRFFAKVAGRGAGPAKAAGLLERVRTKTAGLGHKLKKGLHALRRNPEVLWRVALLTVAFYGLAWINVYVSFRAFGVSPGFAGVVAVLSTAMMIAMIPVAPLAGLGLSEFSYVFYFGLVGIDTGASLAMALLLRSKLLLLGLLGLLCHVSLGDRVERYDEFRARP